MNFSRTVLFSLIVIAMLAMTACGPAGETTGTGDQTGPGVDTLDPDSVEQPDGVLPDGVIPDGVVPPKDNVEPPEDGFVPPEDGWVDVPEDSGTECAGPGEFMCECDDNGDCIDGYCVQWGNGKVCTQSCIEDCPNGWQCVQDVQSLPDVKYICLPEFQFLCTPCNDDEECKSIFADNKDRCVDYGGNGSFCGADCADSGECPNDYLCAEFETELGQLIHQCIPAGGECECTPWMVEDAAQTNCTKSNGFGTCEGIRFCGPNGLTDCDAQTPAAESCNGEDDNCDGEIDPPEANGCINWYKDEDGDGYGIGAGLCLCESPGGNYVNQGGDCDDSNLSVHPGVEEVCDYEDNDCDGEMDEAWADGCDMYWEDADGDGVGVEGGETICLCNDEDGWSMVKGDCDDENPGMFPGNVEVCDVLDNDCNGVIDEENSMGCVPYFLDQDGDGYGLSDVMKCLCAPFGDYDATKGGDCDDTLYNVHPTVVEICDGLDNDCNGEIDEGEAVSSCGSVAHGTVICDGGCIISECEATFFDIDESYVNGCECELEDNEVVGQLCDSAENLGNLPDSGDSEIVEGKIVPAGDSDWYKFQALDGQDPQGCDTFHVSAWFEENPMWGPDPSQVEFVFDVFRSSCAGADNICVGSTVFDDFVDFHDDKQQGYPNGGGECPCKPYGDTTSISEHECADQTSWYFVRVYRHPEAPVTCNTYKIVIGNGVNAN